ncbi:hypothetical protein ACQR1I_32925 [Bradyrhizobium sp. HKCCYLS2038]|uniref:hypothetical protein n=1 Tax=unclassified Bradyrhizobium TaxID=2631580 RepID=UPI003EC0A142
MPTEKQKKRRSSFDLQDVLEVLCDPFGTIISLVLLVAIMGIASCFRRWRTKGAPSLHVVTVRPREEPFFDRAHELRYASADPFVRRFGRRGGRHPAIRSTPGQFLLVTDSEKGCRGVSGRVKG